MDNGEVEILQINGCITLCKIFGYKEPPPTSQDQHLPPDTENVTEFLINNYTVISSDGKVSSFIDEIECVEEPLFMQEFRDLQNDTVITERFDGTIMTHYNDGSLLVVYPDGTEIKSSIEISPEEIICELSLAEIYDNTSTELASYIMEDFDKFFPSGDILKDTSEMEEPELEIIEGFTVINITVSVHHPKYASFRYDPKQTEFELGLSKSCKVRVSESGKTKVEIREGVTFEIDAEKATLTKSEGEETVCCRLARFGLGEEIWTMEHSSGLWASLSREGEFKSSKYQPCFDSESYCVYQGQKGIRLFDEGTAKDYMAAGITHKYSTPTRIDFTVMNPPEGDELEPPSKKPPPLIPSTYGDDWLFPFQKGKKNMKITVKMGEEKDEELPSALVVRKFYKAECGDEALNNFQNMLINYQKFLVLDDSEAEEESEEIEEVEEKESVEDDDMLMKLYLRGPTEDKAQDKELEKYMREKILLHVTKVGLIARANRRDYKQYLFHRKALVNKEIPKYFDSPIGAVRLMTLNVEEKVGEEIESMYKDQESILLNKPLSKFTQEDIDILEDLLVTGEHPFWSKNPSSYTMREVLEAGKQLAKYYPTMWHVLMQNTQNCNFGDIAEIDVTKHIRRSTVSTRSKQIPFKKLLD
jgi:hypothetical protein